MPWADSNLLVPVTNLSRVKVYGDGDQTFGPYAGSGLLYSIFEPIFDAHLGYHVHNHFFDKNSCYHVLKHHHSQPSFPLWLS